MEREAASKSKTEINKQTKTRRTSSTAAVLLRFQVECPPPSLPPPLLTCSLKPKEVRHQFQGPGDQVQTTSVPPFCATPPARGLSVCKQSFGLHRSHWDTQARRMASACAATR
ncbi:hypothetical protein AVEN_271907-1 [Araneus ventricosus]|uniref:Uncharacterized protein n=1 Tax=Araneus ventricosus TaxID=182803 RepID=A0A4Y2CB28_ARAVE|nr:hypothetical protein AVEN_271907-1 [Araneus ventricosus]